MVRIGAAANGREGRQDLIIIVDVEEDAEYWRRVELTEAAAEGGARTDRAE